MYQPQSLSTSSFVLNKLPKKPPKQHRHQHIGLAYGPNYARFYTILITAAISYPHHWHDNSHHHLTHDAPLQFYIFT
ncbi:hypothetical protein BDB00DRAFT_898879, partial [Zychaea mexicana]|uniref:uncharacterized protein n=1 Tax=Zychaea mexicana TaxID=64656 RepID=UPI0022FEFD47